MDFDLKFQRAKKLSFLSSLKNFELIERLKI